MNGLQSKPSYTPGPWTISGVPGDNHVMAMIGHERKTVAIVPGWPGITPEEHEANLKLIRCVPDMLQACQAALPLIVDMIDFCTAYIQSDKDRQAMKEAKELLESALTWKEVL